MKKLPIFLFVGVVALIAYSMVYLRDKKFSIKPSKTKSTETRKVDEFDKIQVDGVFEVDVTYSSKEEVVVEAPTNIQKLIKLKVKSGTLIVELDKNTSVSSSQGFKIHIKTAKLYGFNLSGASSITLNNKLKDDSFILESSGAATFMGSLDVEEAEIESSGAASIKLSGTASEASLNLSGASHLNDYDFNVDKLTVDLSGASSATITSSNSLSGDVSGASSLNYKGNPNVTDLSKSGAASAEGH